LGHGEIRRAFLFPRLFSAGKHQMKNKLCGLKEIFMQTEKIHAFMHVSICHDTL
jgi:hypothetical protein